MITEEKLATLRNVILCDVHETTWLEIMDTLSALWRVAKAAEAVAEAARTFDDRVANMEKLRKAIDSLREGKE